MEKEKKRKIERLFFFTYGVSLEILDYFLFKITSKTQEFDLFGKFHKLGNVYQVFRCISIGYNGKPFKIYFDHRVIKYMIFHSWNLFFSVSPLHLKNLVGLEFNGHWVMKMFCGMNINRKIYPKLNFLSLNCGTKDPPIIKINLELYPKNLKIYEAPMLPENYFCKYEAKNLRKLTVENKKLYNIYDWVPLDNLVELKLMYCETDIIFQTQMFPNLKKLIVGYSGDLTGNNWIGCKNIEVFKIYGERNFNPKNLEKFPNLRELYYFEMSSIFIDIKFPETLRNFVVRCDLDEKTMNNLVMLESLSIGYTETISEYPKFRNLVCLELSYIDENNALKIFEDNFYNLRILRLTRVNVTSINNNLCSKLEVLGLIMVKGISNIFKCVNFSNLREIYLWTNELDYEGWLHLPKVESLIFLGSFCNLFYIFNHNIFKNLRKIFLHIKSSIYMDMLDPNDINENNFKSITEIEITGPKLGADFLLSKYKFPNLKSIFIYDTLDKGKNWKYLKNLKIVSGYSNNMERFSQFCQPWIREKCFINGFLNLM